MHGLTDNCMYMYLPVPYYSIVWTSYTAGIFLSLVFIVNKVLFGIIKHGGNDDMQLQRSRQGFRV